MYATTILDKTIKIESLPAVLIPEPDSVKWENLKLSSYILLSLFKSQYCLRVITKMTIYKKCTYDYVL